MSGQQGEVQEAELTSRFPNLARLSGGSYAGDAAAMATAIDSQTPSDEVLVVTEGVVGAPAQFADALSMAAVAADMGLPMLFVEPEGVPAPTCDWLTGRGVSTLHIAGLEAAVSSEVEADLLDCAGQQAQAVRYGGVTRIETSQAIARAFFPAPDGIAVADGYNWQDAVTGANLSAVYDAPVLLTDGQGNTLEPGTVSYIEEVLTPELDAWVLGGDRAVSEPIEVQFEGLLP